MGADISTCRPVCRQRGVAIITVMLMVTLAAIAVTSMVMQQRLDIYRAGNRQAGVQAKKLALAGERFAVQQLHIDRREAERGNSDSLDDDWSTPTPPFPVEGGAVAGCIVDLQGRFNLNSLVDDEGKLNVDQRDMLKRLFDVLDIDPVKVSAIIDWLDADANILDADGAEDDYYSLRTPAYLAANRRFSNLSELKLVKGFNTPDDAEDYEQLLSHVSALPESTAVNVNTATPAVLESLIDFVDQQKAETLSRWPEQGWKSYPECGEAPTVEDNLPIGGGGDDKDAYEEVDAFVAEINSERNEDEDKFENTDLISVHSRYFEARVDVALGPVEFPQFTLLRRNDDGIVTVLQRARGDNLLQIEGAGDDEDA